MFPPDVAVVYYDGFFSLLLALWRLTSQPSLREAIAREGQRKVLSAHSQVARARQLISLMNDRFGLTL